MTRCARRGNRKAPLDATSWKSLKANENERLIDEGDSSVHSVDSSPSSTKLRKVKKKGGKLKETKKPKLTETVSKKLSKKYKQTLTSKKCREQLDSSGTVSLLPSSSDSDGGVCAHKKSKKKRPSISFGGSSVLHYDTGSPLNVSTDSHGNSSPGRGLLKEPLIRKNKMVGGGKRERLLAARRLRRQKRKVCFNCRRSGHLVQNCPQPRADSSVAGICFKCGSSEHTSRTCTSNSTEGDYPYAKCFICGEVGHLSRSCPDNPKGLYPNGGCCKLCGSVEHLRSNCPEKLSIKSKSGNSEPGFSGRGLVVDPHASADAEDLAAAHPVHSSGGVRDNRGKGKRIGNIRTNSTKHKVVQF